MVKRNYIINVNNIQTIIHKNKDYIFLAFCVSLKLKILHTCFKVIVQCYAFSSLILYVFFSVFCFGRNYFKVGVMWNHPSVIVVLRAKAFLGDLSALKRVLSDHVGSVTSIWPCLSQADQDILFLNMETWDKISWATFLDRRSVSRSVLIFKRGGKFLFHAPIGVLVYW